MIGIGRQFRLRTLATLACVVATSTIHAARWPSWADAPERAAIVARYSGSDAVVLSDEWNLSLKGGERSGVRRRIVDVLTEDGAKKTSLVVRRGSFNRVFKVKAWVRHPDGSVAKFDEDDGTLYSTASITILDDSEILVLTPRGASPGCTVAFEYGFSEKADLPQDLFTIHEDIPIHEKTIRVEARQGWQIDATVAPGDNPGPSGTTAGGVWTFRDVPARPMAAGRFAPVPPRTMLSLNYRTATGPSVFRDWDSVARWGVQLFRLTGDDEAVAASAIARAVETGTDAVLAAGRIARHVRYFAIEIGWGGFVPRKPISVLSRALGDCKDKSQLMVALLRQMGFDAVPVLAVAPSHNFVQSELPSPFQFNHCIVGVLWRGRERGPGMVIVDAPGLGPLRLFDPTLPESSEQELPLALEGGAGLALDERTTGLMRFPASRPEDNVAASSSQWSLDANGAVDVRFEDRFSGAMRMHLEDEDGDILDPRALRSRLFAEIGRDCPGLAGLDVGRPSSEAGRAWSYAASYRCPGLLTDLGDFALLELPRGLPAQLFALPGSKGEDIRYQALLGTIRESYDVNLGDKLAIRLPSAFRVTNSLGSVAVEIASDAHRVSLIREVIITSREVPLAKKDQALELQQALRRADRSVLILQTRADVQSGDNP